MIHDEAIESQNACEEAGVVVAAQAESRGREVFPLLTGRVTRASTPLFAENLRRGAKPRSEWMCGVELELFGYDLWRDYARINPTQVQRVLAGFASNSNDLVYEENVLVEVDAGQMNRLTIEPGGQVEFSGAPQRDLKDVEVVLDELPFGLFAEIEGEENSIREVEEQLGLADAEAEMATYPELTSRYGEQRGDMIEARFPIADFGLRNAD